MKKILFVTSRLDAGGAEKWCRDVILHMNRHDLKIDYYFYEGIINSAFIDDYRDAEVRLFFRKLNEKVGGPLLSLKKDLARFISENGPYDAIHVNGLGLIYQHLIMKAAVQKSIPVRIVHSHSTFNKHTGVLSKALKNYLRNQIIRNATVVGACSVSAGVARYGEKITESPKFTILKNGIDIEAGAFDQVLRDNVREKLGIGTEKAFIFLGRLSKEKNITFLIDLFYSIMKKDFNSVLMVVGSGDEETNLNNRIKEFGLKENVIRVNWTNSPRDYLCAADLLLLPSISEGFPFVVMEAQCNGLGCLVSENVPEDVNVSNHITRLSLSRDTDVWVEEAVKMAAEKRFDGVSCVRDAGYDINDTSEMFRRLLIGDRI